MKETTAFSKPAFFRKAMLLSIGVLSVSMGLSVVYTKAKRAILAKRKAAAN